VAAPLTYLLDRHYGLTLNDTPFGEEAIIQECIDAGDSLVDALNEMAEDSELERTDNRGKSLMPVSSRLTPADILSAQNMMGWQGRATSLSTLRHCSS
jgi:cytoskeleton-binding toxin CbtA-like protein